MVDDTKDNGFVPTQKLRHFCQVLLSQEVMGNKDKAMKLSGVNKALFYYNLHKKPGFEEWFKRQCAEALLAYLPQVCYSTVKTAMNGDHSAQKTLLEVLGVNFWSYGESFSVRHQNKIEISSSTVFSKLMLGCFQNMNACVLHSLSGLIHQCSQIFFV